MTVKMVIGRALAHFIHKVTNSTLCVAGQSWVLPHCLDGTGQGREM